MSSSSIDSSDSFDAISFIQREKKRSRELFNGNQENLSFHFPEVSLFKLNVKIGDEYANVKDLPPPVAQSAAKSANNNANKSNSSNTTKKEEKVVKLAVEEVKKGVSVVDGDSFDPNEEVVEESEITKQLNSIPSKAQKTESNSLIVFQGVAGDSQNSAPAQTKALALRNPYAEQKPEWHYPWKLARVISGHLGWVNSVAMDPTNEWFVTGSADRTIKVWDLASGQLRTTLTKHIGTIRGLVVSDRHPYLFSVAEDKQVLNWDLEVNKVIRHYHGHLSGVYCCALHPTLDLLITGGRDSSVRVWDIRTKASIFVMTGHTNTVATLVAQGTDPQIISGSADSTIRYWDLRTGKSSQTLTHHKKGIRSVIIHPEEYTMASASPDNIKQWKFPEGKFMKNFGGHNAIINTLSVNRDNVMVSGADNGSMYFWDWRTGYNFQKVQTIAQSGSLDAEAGILCSTFDVSGSRLIVGEVDKTIKIYKEDETATEATHPMEDWRTQQANVKKY